MKTKTSTPKARKQSRRKSSFSRSSVPKGHRAKQTPPPKQATSAPGNIDWDQVKAKGPPLGGAFKQKAIFPQDSILEDYFAYATQQKESADVYIIGSILAVCAALLARRFYLQWGDDKVYPNLFTMLAGKAGDRKTDAVRLARLIARECLPPEAFLPKAFSPESLFDEYYPAAGGRPDKLWLVDDANATLTDWNKSANGERTAPRFLELYDCEPMSESFMRNKSKKNPQPRRFVPETSTSIVFGATFNVACFQGQAIRAGMARRFIFYVSEGHGRVVIRPTVGDITNLVSLFDRLKLVAGPIDFSPAAYQFWEDYQKKNRALIDSTDPLHEAELCRLSSAPMQTLHIAMIFQAARAAKANLNNSGVLEIESLELAAKHMEECLKAAFYLESIANRAQIASDAQILIERIRHDFMPQLLPGTQKKCNAIYLSRTDLTAAYAHHSRRANTWKPDDLYLRMIPHLEALGLATLAFKKGKFELYAFKATDFEP